MTLEFFITPSPRGFHASFADERYRSGPLKNGREFPSVAAATRFIERYHRSRADFRGVPLKINSTTISPTPTEST